MNKKEKNEESKKNKEFFEAVKLLSKDTGVTVDAMCESIQNVLIGALKKEYNNKDIVFCDVDAEKGETPTPICSSSRLSSIRRAPWPAI